MISPFAEKTTSRVFSPFFQLRFKTTETGSFNFLRFTYRIPRKLVLMTSCTGEGNPTSFISVSVSIHLPDASKEADMSLPPRVNSASHSFGFSLLHLTSFACLEFFVKSGFYLTRKDRLAKRTDAEKQSRNDAG